MFETIHLINDFIPFSQGGNAPSIGANGINNIWIKRSIVFLLGVHILYRIQPSIDVAIALLFIIASASFRWVIQVLIHPHSIANGDVFIHLTISNILECSTPAFWTYFRCIETGG